MLVLEMSKYSHQAGPSVINRQKQLSVKTVVHILFAVKGIFPKDR